MTETKALIIPAAGSGNRMQKQIPKPYLEVKNRTILERTIRAFLPLDSLRQIIVATSELYLDTARKMLETMLPDHIRGQVVDGGQQRQDSIRNALRVTGDVTLVLVHDAVRPFVKFEHIQECCRAASEVGAAALGIPSRDTIKRLDDRRLVLDTPSRAIMWQAQTPQVFKKPLLVEAYERAAEDQFTGTDDASLVERMGSPVRMIEGDRRSEEHTSELQ